MDRFRSDNAPPRGGLQLASRDGGGAALARAMDRLSADVSAAEPVQFPLDLAALVAGSADAVLRARLLHEATDRVLFPLMAARYAAWTGDLQSVASACRRFLATDAPWTPPGAEAAVALWLAGLAELERTVTDLGLARDAARLHSLGAGVRETLRGRAISAETAALLTALRVPLPGMAAPRWTDMDDIVPHAWQTWAALERGLLRAGMDGWRRLVDEANSPVRGASPALLGTTADCPDAAALFVLTLAHGLLGIEPDAHRSRIRIAPRFATPTESFAVHGIRCGDAVVSLRADAAGCAITLRIAQDAGAIPLTALLEPVVEGVVAAVFVDQRAAELDVRPHGEGSAVPVLIVLDAERTLRIERADRG
jgi:hypothetical protein